MLNVYSGVQIRNLDNACLAESSVSSLYLFKIWFLKISLRKKESRILPGLVISTRLRTPATVHWNFLTPILRWLAMVMAAAE
jgi:hypothetical protein